MGANHRISRAITANNLSTSNTLPFYIAADRPGTYLEAAIGEGPAANYEADANTVGLWHLEEQTGSGSYFKDSSDNGNHASIGAGSPTFVQGKIGKARDFNSNSIALGSLTISPQGSPFSVFAWIKTTQIGAGQGSSGLFFLSETALIRFQ